MAIDFFPFQEGQVVTIAQWNELFNAIKDGSFLLSSTLYGNLEDRVSSLENRVNALSAVKGKICRKEQFQLSAGQTQVVLSNNVIQDSEILFYNSTILIKNNVPAGMNGDYYMVDNVIHFNSELSNEIEDGDYLVVSYWTKEI